MPRKAGYQHLDTVRDKIKASLIIKRLQDCAEGNLDLTTQQVNAAKTLLNKVLPDLKAIEHSGEGGGPIHSKISWEVVQPKPQGS